MAKQTRKQPAKKPPAKPSSEGSAKKKAAPTPAKPRRSLLGALFYWTAVLAVWGAIAVGGVLVWYAYDLPDVSALDAIKRRPSITVLDRNGETVASLGEVYGEAVQVADLPPYLPQAVIAIEDRRFYSHFGVDPLGLARAMIANLMAGRVVQGGSTITQQLAKNVFLNPDRTLKRKVQEVLLAFWLEANFSKDQLLTLYLNRVYLGAGAYGVDAAARRYFGKPASQVSLQEAAMLAGLLKAPTRYAPTNDLKAARERANVVIASMEDAGFIDEQQMQSAQKAPAGLGRSKAPGLAARYFIDWIMDRLPDYLGPTDRNLTISTSLDMSIQRASEAAVEKMLAGPGSKARVGQAAALVMTPDGAVVAMVGGRSYQDSQFNRAVQARRQPGSAFKPVIYLAGLEKGLEPDSVLTDSAIRIAGWSPSNYDNKYRGPVTLTEALAHSINTVAAQVWQRAGAQSVADVAGRLGFGQTIPAQPSVALGTIETSMLELAGAYAVFANGGIGVLPHGIQEIRDTGNGEVLYRRHGGGPGRVVPERETWQMTQMLQAVIREGTGRGAALDRPAAGKTGTSQDYRDAWFAGYTAQYVATVWLGNDDNAPMKRVTGGGLPARLWRDIMLAAHKGLPALDLQARPSGGFAGGDFGSLVERLLKTLGGGSDTTTPASGGTRSGGTAPPVQKVEPYEQQPGR